MRGALVVLLFLAIFAASCSSSDGDAQPTTTGTTAQVETSALEVEQDATSDPTASGSLSAADIPEQMEPGEWAVDLGTLTVDLVSDETMDVAIVAAGELLLSVPDPSGSSAFRAFGVFELTGLHDTTSGGVLTAQLPPAADLGPWLGGLEDVTVLSSGQAEISGNAATWWRFDLDGSCSSCFRALFSGGTGAGSSVYGGGTGLGWQVWTIELESKVVAITLEAPVDDFDAFAAQMQPLIESLELADVPGASAWQASGTPFATGRMEVVVRDDSRETPAVASVGAVGTDVLDHRSILVDLLYPSEAGGWDAAPADGSFPLVILAPGLGDYGGVGPLDLELAQAGYVVARLRYPGSSWPGQIRTEIDEQPRDTSVVLDALLTAGLPPELAAVVDAERIGAVGVSMGGTTVYGLLGGACCLDPRIDAAVAHAPTTYEFGGELLFADTPLLIITSEADEFAPRPVVLAVQELSPTTISTFVLASGAHLEWLLPTSPDYEVMVDLTVAFLDAHVAGIDTDLSMTIEGAAGDWAPATK